MSCRRTITLLAALALMAWAADAQAQSYGIELQNSLMPASGGMGGASISRPQDLQSAINGNPAALTQFRGTQFSFGGAWAEPTYNVTQLSTLPGVGVSPYSAKSGTPGSPLGNIGVTQDFSALGLPATAGLGLMTNAGAGVDFRGIPASNGTSAEYLALDMIVGAGVDLTDRLAVGASMATRYFVSRRSLRRFERHGSRLCIARLGRCQLLVKQRYIRGRLLADQKELHL